jgi:Flp pilus assembly CpaF family ATPase
LPPDERLLVLESEPELGLDRLPHRHNHVVSVHERPGNIEGDGAVLLDDLTWHAKRLSPSRIVVGEVLADEVVPMLEAMTQGVPGSATIHARSSAGVFPRLPVYARSRGRDWRSSDIYEQAALALDLVVFVGRDAAGRRVVSEVRHVERYDSSSDQVISDAWFLADTVTGQATQASVIPVPLLDELAAHGYRPDGQGSPTGRGSRR